MQFSKPSGIYQAVQLTIRKQSQQQGIPFSMSSFSFERKGSITATTVSSWICFHGSRPSLVPAMGPLDVDQA